MLQSFIQSRGMRQRRLCANVNNICALRLKKECAANAGLNRRTDAFAVPRIRREVDHAHDTFVLVRRYIAPTNSKFADLRPQCRGMRPGQLAQILQQKHLDRVTVTAKPLKSFREKSENR